MKLEQTIQDEVRKFLMDRGWLVLRMHCNAYQMGIPDLYACRKGMERWIEIKRPKRYKLTNAQRHVFPLLEEQSVGVWIMTSTKDYPKLFEAPNWKDFLSSRS